MKAYVRIVLAVMCMSLMLGCTGQNETKESSVEEVPVVSRALTAYEKKST